MTYLSETLDYARFLATPTGLEPVTLCLEGRCSILQSVLKINDLKIFSLFW